MTPMREKSTWRRVAAPALVSSLLLSAGCITKTATEDDNSSNTVITVVSMTAAAGGTTSASGDDLFSDVCDGSSSTSTGCTVINDNAIVEMVGQVKDQTTPFSTVNDVIFTRYRVTYIRADGRNVAGVDVPYPFDGASNFTVSADGSAVTRSLVVVRQQAKLETPLRELHSDGIHNGGSLVLSTIAQIDFYGQDVAGRAVKVTGYLNVTFADF
jgi:hypothetical protein